MVKQAWREATKAVMETWKGVKLVEEEEEAGVYCSLLQPNHPTSSSKAWTPAEVETGSAASKGEEAALWVGLKRG